MGAPASIVRRTDGLLVSGGRERESHRRSLLLFPPTSFARKLARKAVHTYFHDKRCTIFRNLLIIFLI